MQLEPMQVAMTNSHVIATSEDVVYIWNYRSSVSRQAQVSRGVGFCGGHFLEVEKDNSKNLQSCDDYIVFCGS